MIDWVVVCLGCACAPASRRLCPGWPVCLPVRRSGLGSSCVLPGALCACRVWTVDNMLDTRFTFCILACLLLADSCLLSDTRFTFCIHDCLLHADSCWFIRHFGCQFLLTDIRIFRILDCLLSAHVGHTLPPLLAPRPGPPRAFGPMAGCLWIALAADSL